MKKRIMALLLTAVMVLGTILLAAFGFAAAFQPSQQKKLTELYSNLAKASKG